MNLDSFRLGSIMIHDVPRPDDEHDELILTDAPVALDHQLTRYFERKIVQSLKQRGHDVVADPTASEIIRAGTSDILNDEAALVAASQRMAAHLFESQTRRNPAGLLAVGIGAVEEGPAACVLKLEREQGLRLRIEVVRGQTHVALQFLRDLTLTDKTRIFKTSLLRLLEPLEPSSLVGVVSDDQRGRDDGAGVAQFFLATFLGCQLAVNPARATLDFAQAAEAFFNEEVPSAERRASYQVALLATLQAQDMDIQPREFAAAHLEAADRPAFLERLRNNGVDPDRAFQKDTSLAKVNGFKLVFEHGMTLVGSQRDLEQRVRPTANGVVIADTMKRLQGR